MDNELSKDTEEFLVQLVRLNGTMKELFSSGNIELFPEMNDAIKKMHAVQHGSKDAVLEAVDPECAVIYGNFDMIVKLLRTTDGEIDAATQKGLNKLLHNIDEAVVNIAAAVGLV